VQVLDEDGDGVISKEEFKTSLRSGAMQGMLTALSAQPHGIASQHILCSILQFKSSLFVLCSVFLSLDRLLVFWSIGSLFVYLE
jgi:hypothetical protein